MQSVSSWIWTYVAVSISYDGNDYITGTSFLNGISTKWNASHLSGIYSPGADFISYEDNHYTEYTSIFF